MWFELYRPPSSKEAELLEEVLASWFMLGRLGAYNTQNLQVTLPPCLSLASIHPTLVRSSRTLCEHMCMYGHVCVYHFRQYDHSAISCAYRTTMSGSTALRPHYTSCFHSLRQLCSVCGGRQHILDSKVLLAVVCGEALTAAKLGLWIYRRFTQLART